MRSFRVIGVNQVNKTLQSYNFITSQFQFIGQLIKGNTIQTLRSHDRCIGAQVFPKTLLSSHESNRLQANTSVSERALKKMIMDLYEQIGRQIAVKGCAHLVSAKWEHQLQLIVSHNNVGNQGCKILAMAPWNHLQTLWLIENNIGAEGCKHLTAANWKNLWVLQLTENNIGAQGCKYLALAKLQHLQVINLTP